MHVSITETVYTIKQAQDFLKTFPEDTLVSNVSTSTSNGGLGMKITVVLEAVGAEMIDCGDHVTQPYPQDLLIELHSHA